MANGIKDVSKKAALDGLMKHMKGLALKKRRPDLAIYIDGAPHGADAYTEEGKPEDEGLLDDDATSAPGESPDKEEKDGEGADGSPEHEKSESLATEEQEQYDDEGDDDPLIKRIKKLRRSKG